MVSILALSSVVSRLLGVIRQNRFADMFGAGDLSDAYFAAFTIPDFFYSVIVYGALSAAFVPLFMRYLKEDKRQEMWEFTSAVLKALTGMILAISLMLFVFAPLIMSTLYPGFTTEVQVQAVHLMRIMLLSLIFFSFSAVFSSIQTSYRHFIFYGLAPIVYNACIIFGIIYLGPIYGINGVAYGVVAGAFLHALIQFPILFRLGFRFIPSVRIWSEDMRKLLTLAIPRVLGLIVLQVNFLIEGAIVTLAGAGALSILRYAQDIQSFPIGVIGLSVAVSSFATLSELALNGDGHEKFRQHLSENINRILFLIIPASVGLWLLREPLTQVILESGAFSAQDTALTTQVLTIFCFSIFASSLIPLLSRAFFSLHDTKHPLYLGIVAITVNVVVSLMLIKPLGVLGVAYASATSSVIYLVLLTHFLKKQFASHGRLFDPKTISKILFSTSVMAVIVYGLQIAIKTPEYLTGQLIFILGMGIAGILIYLVAAHISGLHIPYLRQIIRSRS